MDFIRNRLPYLKVADYALLCGKCVFNHGNMYVSIKEGFIFIWLKFLLILQ